MRRYAQIPDTLDIDRLIQQFTPTIPRFSKEKLLRLIDLVTYQVTHTNWPTFYGHVQIMSKQFRDVADDYLLYIEYLMHAGVITRDTRYKPSALYPDDPKSMGYRFVEPHDSAATRRDDLFALHKSERMITRQRSRAKKEPDKEDSADRAASIAYGHLRDAYPFIRHLDELLMDFDAAYRCIDIIQPQLKGMLLTDSARAKASHRLTKCSIAIDKFRQAPSREVSIDDFGNRLHSPLTQLKKELRCFLSYKGKSLVALDVKNCQPFLSLALTNPEFWRPEKMMFVDVSTLGGKLAIQSSIVESWTKGRTPQSLTVGHLYPDFEDVLFYGGRWPVSPPKSPQSNASVPPLADLPPAAPSDIPATSDQPSVAAPAGKEGVAAISIVSGLRSGAFDTESFTLFRDRVAKGQLYEHLVAWMRTVIHKPGYHNALMDEDIAWDDCDEKIQRNAAKALMVRAMFGPRSSNKPIFQFAGEMMDANFHQMSWLYWKIKKGNHKAMAKVLQRIESFLILRAIAKAIHKTNTGIPFWTIHDCVVTTEGHLNDVRELMTTTMATYVGISPEIGVEYWSEYHPSAAAFLDEDPDEFLDSDEYSGEAENT